MLSRKAIECALLMLCFVALACGEDDGQVQTSTQNKRTESSQEANEDLRRMRESLAAAAIAVGKAQTALSDAAPAPAPDRSQSSPALKPPQPARAATSPSATRTPAPRQVTVEVPDLAGALKEVNAAVRDLEQANDSLDSLSSALIAGTVAGDTQAALGDVRKGITNALSTLKGAASEFGATPDEADERASKIARDKNKSDLKAAQDGIKSATAAAARITVPENLAAPPSFFSQLLSDWGATISIALGVLFGLILLALGAKALVKSMGAEFEKQLTSGVKPSLSGIQKQQKDFATQLSALAASNNEMSTRIGDTQTEVRSLSRLIRDASLDGARRAPASADSYPPTDQPPPRDEPVFPISTVDYLGKMQRLTLVVKPDFQNGILVTDPDGKGELALIRDPKVDDDMQSLFVVPRAAGFQTKQDFHTYYEKYYDCTRPSAGEVWIVEPAVVSKVQGGWQLRKKGVLEIR